MEYKIKDLSKIFDISPEGIRYYDKLGITNPSRDENSNYRVYDTWDVFSLMDCTLYKKFGFSVKEFEDLTSGGSLSKITSAFKEKIDTLAEEIKQKQLLLDWTVWWQANIEMVELNMGTIWLTRMPEMIFVETGNIHPGDDTSEYAISLENMAQMANLLPFAIPTMHIDLHSMDYVGNVMLKRGGLVHKKYIDEMDYNLQSSYYSIPSQTYLVYCIDIGDIGSFNWQMFSSLIKYIKKKGYESNWQLYGMCISREKVNNIYSRVFQFLIPVKTRESNGEYLE